VQADPRVPRVRDGSAPGGGLRPAGGEDAQGTGHLTHIACQCKHINSQKSCLKIRDKTQLHQINRLGLKGQYQDIFTSFSTKNSNSKSLIAANTAKAKLKLGVFSNNDLIGYEKPSGGC
jgi:hypothetical protein